MNSNLYREEILEHFKDPQNFGELADATHSSKQTNPFCGDEITIFIKVHDSKKRSASIIDSITFIGKGCAISIASASMLTDFAKTKTVEQLTAFSDEDMLTLLGVEVSETRKKCALLALTTLKDALCLIK